MKYVLLLFLFFGATCYAQVDFRTLNVFTDECSDMYVDVFGILDTMKPKPKIIKRSIDKKLNAVCKFKVGDYLWSWMAGQRFVALSCSVYCKDKRMADSVYASITETADSTWKIVAVNEVAKGDRYNSKSYRSWNDCKYSIMLFCYPPEKNVVTFWLNYSWKYTE